MKYSLPFTAALLLAAIFVLWTPCIPLGIPGEWVWERHETSTGLAEALERFLLPILVGTALLLVAWKGREKIEHASASGLLLRYIGLIVVSFFWFVQVQQTTPYTHRVLKPLWVLYDPSSSGYFFEAAFEIDSTRDFLSTYEDRMREGEVLHVGTHPPGLFLVSRWCIDLCEASPFVHAVVRGTISEESAKAFRLVESEFRGARPLTETELSGLQLLVLGTGMAAVLAIIPIGIVTTLLFGRSTGWETSSLWITLPCVAVFFPKSDVLFPLTATSVLACWLLSLQTTRYSLLFAGLAGIVLWAGSMMSLAHIPVVVLIGVMFLLRWWKNSERRRPDYLRLATLVTSFVALSAVWSLGSGCNLFNVWRLNLQNHEGFYGQFARTMWKWALVNPIELALAAGPMLFLTAFNGAHGSVRGMINPESAKLGEVGSHFIFAAMTTFTLLWISGKNQGEAARLWCFLTPWLVVAAAGWLSVQTSSRPWRMLLVLQLIYALFAVSRVNGFSF